MAMRFGDEAWYQMVTSTILALFREENVPPSIEAAGEMFYLAREQSKGADDLRAYLKSFPKTAPPPVPVPTPSPPPPLVVAPRVWSGNMCGVRVPGLPSVPGGAADPTLVLSWFYDRYDAADRARIRAAWKARGYLDVLLSWPDSRTFGQIPHAFLDTIHELQADGFRCCPMLCAKDLDQPDVPAILAGLEPLLALLVGVVPRVCIGWELSLWLSPLQVQQLIDALAPRFTPAGTRVYVHFQQGYFAFSQEVNGHSVTADFWRANVGKLTGVLHQRALDWDTPAKYQARIVDCLQRFAGQFGFPADSGFGHPFDFIALEITASLQFEGKMDEKTGDWAGRVALETPPVGAVHVMGSGNGH